jgi:hypothetical protein
MLAQRRSVHEARGSPEMGCFLNGFLPGVLFINLIVVEFDLSRRLPAVRDIMELR